MSYVSYASAMTINKNTWWINARKSGVYTHMLRRMIAQIDALLSHHSKIHLLRFDLHQCEFTNDNKQITDFNRRLFERIKNHYSVKRIGFIWMREIEKAKQQHYHYVLFIDGHKIQYPATILKWAAEIWEFMDGSRYTPKNCYYQIGRNDHQKLQNAIYRVSYLAKGRGKGYKPPQTKNYSTSRIKPVKQVINRQSA